MSNSSLQTTGNRQKTGVKKSRQKRIWVTDEVTRELIKEFEAVGTTILNALKFASYSAKAKKIRERAMIKMQEVEKSNRDLMNEFH